jgi:hypothetical protein
VDASACPVIRSVREQCRQVEQRSVIGAGEETIEQLEQCSLVLRPLFRFVEHGGAGEYLAPGVGLAFLLPLAPLFFAYAGLWRRFLGEQLFEFLRCHCCLPAGYHATRAASPPLRSKALTTY